MNKSEIRKAVQLSLQTMDPATKKAKEKLIRQMLYGSKTWQEAEVIGITRSMPFELQTTEIIKKAWQQGKRVAVPKVFSKGKMEFIEITSGTMYEESHFGVMEPQNNDILEKKYIDLLIVPGVAFRQDGYRIGFGGGFYDRYLAAFDGQTVSLIFAEQLVATWQPEDHDIAVAQLIIK